MYSGGYDMKFCLHVLPCFVWSAAFLCKYFSVNIYRWQCCAATGTVKEFEWVFLHGSQCIVNVLWWRAECGWRRGETIIWSVILSCCHPVSSYTFCSHACQQWNVKLLRRSSLCISVYRWLSSFALSVVLWVFEPVDWTALQFKTFEQLFITSV